MQISRVSSSRPHGVPSSTRSLKINDRSRRSSETLQINLHRSLGITKFKILGLTFNLDWTVCVRFLNRL
jgi:hypothetical protein